MQKHFNVLIDAELHTRLKVNAIHAGKTLRDYVAELLEKGSEGYVSERKREFERKMAALEIARKKENEAVRKAERRSRAHKKR